MTRPRDLRFLTDENIAPEAIAFLRSRGVDVARARDRGLRGRSDADVLALAVAEQRAVVSHDTDFGALAVAAGAPSHGVVLVRPGDLLPSELVALLDGFLASDVNLSPPFVVVLEPGRIRVRALP